MKWLVAVVMCAGCYRPAADPACAISCVEGVADNCPFGLDCIAGSCRRDNASCPDDAMNPIDTAISTTDSGFCVGSNMPLQVCLSAMPTVDRAITLRTVIDTTICASPLTHNGQTLCVFAYRSLQVAESLRFIGTVPAVIVVAGNVVIEGGAEITVAPDLSAQSGAGSNPADCPTLFGGGNAILGKGGGGGAGGSFASFGGDGGSNLTGDGVGAPKGGGVSPPYTALRGGCSGSAGGNDSNGGSSGPGGAGGGAIAILAGGTIDVNGSVLAYGGGGEGASGPYAGGGGGGAGGMILLDAAQISGAGWVNANGAGGGAGGTSMFNGGEGSQPRVDTSDMGGGGGIAGTGGGQGGQGGAAGDGSVGASAIYGAGGGGGGGGIVLLRGAVAGSLTNVYPRR